MSVIYENGDDDDNNDLLKMSPTDCDCHSVHSSLA